jgi:hypothetical protein
MRHRSIVAKLEVVILKLVKMQEGTLLGLPGNLVQMSESGFLCKFNT